MTRRKRRRVDIVGPAASIGAVIVTVALIWFAGKLGSHIADHTHEVSR